MWRRLIALICLASVLGAAHSARAGLIGYWPLSEGAGGQAIDKSGKGHNGTINGATWVIPGWDGRGACLQFNGVNARVEVPHANDLRFAATAKYTLAAWVNWTTLPGHWSGVVTKGREVGNWYGIWLDTNNNWVFGHGGNNQIGSAAVPNVWIHVAMVYDNGTKTIYLNGRLDNRTVSSQNGDNTGDLWFGAAKGVTEFAPARIDDILIYDQALTDVEIQSIMKGLSDKSLAQAVNPADAATDVPRDATLNWTAGQYPSTHDVYLGTVFADVNTASRTAPKSLLASQGQTATTFDPAGLFAYGQTYYWRIDEVNNSADKTIYKGGVWSFTAEPYGYPVTPVKATASSAQASMGPEKTIDGSGLDKSDLHGTEPTTMWMSAGVPPNWIQYEFDRAYKLHNLLVWNSNQLIEGFLGFGAKKVTIETSGDGTTWTALANVPEFAKATGLPGYAANTTVNFGGVEAKFVKLTINANWGGMAPQTGLAEVRFSYVPVQARAPQPATAAKSVSVDASLDWRPGREAASHKVFFGTDANAVTNGTAAAKSVADHGYGPGLLNLGATYYWRVDEVNAVTYPGSVWSFTTQDYKVVDDFESYTDKAGAEIFSTWIDGFADNYKSSGSTVGKDQAVNGTFGETTILHGGKQSMPLAYDNTKAPNFSEAVRTFDTPQDWTASGIKSLSLWFQGTAGNGGQLYVKINSTKVPYDGDAADLARAAWHVWNIDLSQAGKVNGVRSLTIGIEGSGAKGTLYLDDIRLYPKTPEYITPIQPAATNLAAYYTFDEGSGTTAKDSSGNGNNGTINGNPQWVAGKVGGVLAFDGAGDYVNCGKGASLVIRDTITVACWIKVASFTRSWETILGMGDDSYRMSRSATTGNSIHFGCNGPTGGNLDAKTLVNTDTWRHVALVYDGVNKIIYIDGIEDARLASTGRINVSAYNLYIGANSQQTGRDLKGVVDDVRIYSRPLSAGEVAGLAGQTQRMAKPF